MTDSRFPTPGQDTRFATPGADARFPSPGTDTRFPSPGTDTRFDGSAPPDLKPPVNLTAPRLVLEDPTTLVYTVGTWAGLVPITLEGRIWLNGVDVAPAAPGLINVLPEWQGQLVAIFEIATNDDGQMFASSNQVSIPVPVVPPVNTKAPVLALSGDNNTLTYTAGVWTGSPTPTVKADLHSNSPDWPVFGVPVEPGNFPVDDALRGFIVNVLESASNDGGASTIQRVSNIVPIPAPPPPDLDAEVQAILAGRAGCVFDLTDWSTMTEDNGAAIPITQIGQMIGTVSSKWGTLVYRFGQGTLARRPSAVAGGALFDGVDDSMVGDLATLSFAADAAHLTAGISVTPAAVGGSRHPLYFSQPATTSNRFDFLINPGANVRGLARRLVADTFGDVISPALATANEEHVLFMQADYAQTNQLVLRIDDAEIGTDSIPGIAGTNADPGQSASATLGSARPGANPHNGKIKRIFLARFLLTEAERQIVEAWLGEDV